MRPSIDRASAHPDVMMLPAGGRDRFAERRRGFAPSLPEAAPVSGLGTTRFTNGTNSLINNRQNGRRRGRNGNGQRTGSPGNPGGGSRIDNRARGNASQLYEKYKSLARDAQMSGDRVNTEYYLQFADHYFRVLSESRGRPDEQGQRRITPVDSFDDLDGDDDYGDEGEPVRAGEQGAPVARDQRRDGAGQGGRDQVSRDQGSRDQGSRDEDRRDGGRGSYQREGAPREDGRQHDGRQRDDNRTGDTGRRRDQEPSFRAGREDMQREDMQRGDGSRSDGDHDLALTGSPVTNDPGEDSPDGAEPTPITPRRRGRPRRDAAATATAPAPAPAAGEEPVAIDADRLPPALAVSSAPAAPDEEPRPRRRRTRAVTSNETADAN